MQATKKAFLLGTPKYFLNKFSPHNKADKTLAQLNLENRRNIQPSILCRRNISALK